MQTYKLSKAFSAQGMFASFVLYISFYLFFCIILINNSTYFLGLLAILFIFFASSSFKYTMMFMAIFSSQNAEKCAFPEELPIYTILLPVRSEIAVISSLIKNIGSIEYPHEKLDVKLIINESDNETRAFVSSLKLPPYFEVVIVPLSKIETKAAACNYALQFAKGEYLTIYDADDQPDILQLKKAVKIFQNSDANLACLQSYLNFYNYNYNILTRFFALEYLLWFNYILPGLQKRGMPVPLGGSSNHFRVEILRKIGAWDDYNVTEDADLGLRLSLFGYEIAMLSSNTQEEAPISIYAWIRQRSRWIKGYIVTYLVHLRHYKLHYKRTGIRGMMLLHLFVGASSLTFLITPFVILSIFLNKDYFYASLIYCTFSYFLQYISLFYAIRNSSYDSNMYFIAVFFSIYLFLHSIAGIFAIYELAIKPFYWYKTEHGFYAKK